MNVYLNQEKLDELEDYLKDNFEDPELAVLHMCFETCWLLRHSYSEDENEKELTEVREEMFARVLLLMNMMWREMSGVETSNIEKFYDMMRREGFKDDDVV
jgi:hypothetical protein